MTAIQIKNLNFAYPGTHHEIFKDVSFQMDTAWKLGFTGRNGRGKTTFLKLLCGELPHSGQIHASVEFEYFPYLVSDEALSAYDIARNVNREHDDWQLERETALLDLKSEALERPFSTLSEGERTKILLAILFLKNNAFLLIDEPTNHLDFKGRQLMANYLARKSGFIIVSHDQYFLDQCIDHVLSIDKCQIVIQKGNYTSLLQNKAYEAQFELAQNEKLKKDIHRLADSAKRTSGWADKIEQSKYGNGPVDKGYIGHKSAKMMKRAKQIEHRRARAIEEKQKLLKNVETYDALKMNPLNNRKGTFLRVRELSYQIASQPIFKPLSFNLKAGERLVVKGPNGSGKSSLLKGLLTELGLETNTLGHFEGNMELQSGLIISYVSQDTSHLKGSFASLAASVGIDLSLLQSVLVQLDFERTQFEKSLEQLSEGQKKKLLLACSLCQPSHLYIWDEPLNYIDIWSRRQIEDVILRYEPTMIFIEHDQSFSQRIATHSVSLEK